MSLRNTIGGFTQIERCQAPFAGALLGQEPIWHLILKTDLTQASIRSVISTDPFAFEEFNEFTRNGLLRVLHAGGLDRDDSRCFERLRNRYDLYRSFGSGFKEINLLDSLGVETPRWKRVFPIGEYVFQTRRPFELIKLRVSAEPISRRSGPMPRHEFAFIEFIFKFTEDITEEES
jgi:hypothetical protein